MTTFLTALAVICLIWLLTGVFVYPLFFQSHKCDEGVMDEENDPTLTYLNEGKYIRMEDRN